MSSNHKNLADRLKIRRVDETDLEKVVSLVGDFYVEEEKADERAITAGKEELKKAIAEKLRERKRNFYFLAYLEKEIVGLLQMFVISERLAELILIYILPKFRGQGVGEFLTCWGVEKLKSWGIKFVRIEVRENNIFSWKIFSKFNPSVYSHIYTINI